MDEITRLQRLLGSYWEDTRAWPWRKGKIQMREARTWEWVEVDSNDLLFAMASLFQFLEYVTLSGQEASSHPVASTRNALFFLASTSV